MHGEVPAEARVAAHVFERVYLHQQRDECDQQQHDYGEAVDMRAPADSRAAGGEPVHAIRGEFRAAAVQVQQRVERKRQARRHRRDGYERAAHGQPTPAERDYDEGGSAEGGD